MSSSATRNYNVLIVSDNFCISFPQWKIWSLCPFVNNSNIVDNVYTLAIKCIQNLIVNHILLSFCWWKYNRKTDRMLARISVWIYFYADSHPKLKALAQRPQHPVWKSLGFLFRIRIGPKEHIILTINLRQKLPSPRDFAKSMIDSFPDRRFPTSPTELEFKLAQDLRLRG